jgi:hypothetical protein
MPTPVDSVTSIYFPYAANIYSSFTLLSSFAFCLYGSKNCLLVYKVGEPQHQASRNHSCHFYWCSVDRYVASEGLNVHSLLWSAAEQIVSSVSASLSVWWLHYSPFVVVHRCNYYTLVYSIISITFHWPSTLLSSKWSWPNDRQI